MLGELGTSAGEEDRKKGCSQKCSLQPESRLVLPSLGVLLNLDSLYGKLLTSVWGPDYRQEVDYLRTFVRQLRKKIEDDPSDPKYLLTDAYVGYRFAELPTTSEAPTVHEQAM